MGIDRGTDAEILVSVCDMESGRDPDSAFAELNGKGVGRADCRAGAVDALGRVCSARPAVWRGSRA